MRIKIFGANLRDQSKGQHVVHAADCADCAKFKDEHCSEIEAASFEQVARDIYADQIREGLSVADALQEIHFAPCVKFDAALPPVVFSSSDTEATKATFLASHAKLVKLCTQHGAVICLATTDAAIFIDQCSEAFKVELANLGRYENVLQGETVNTLILL